MRAAVGDLVAAGAADLATTLLDECASIAASQGFPPRTAAMARSRARFRAPGSTLTASMFRDIERRPPIEADHIRGDLLRRSGSRESDSPLLRITDAHLKAYEGANHYHGWEGRWAELPLPYCSTLRQPLQLCRCDQAPVPPVRHNAAGGLHEPERELFALRDLAKTMPGDDDKPVLLL